MENSELFIKALREKSIPCAFHMFSHGGHGLSLADNGWANGEKMNNYTVEQILHILKEMDAGRLEASNADWALSFGRAWGDYSAKKVKIGEPNPEAAVWPLLADSFLHSVLG